MNTSNNTPCGRSCLTCGLCKHASFGPGAETQPMTPGTTKPKNAASRNTGRNGK